LKSFGVIIIALRYVLNNINVLFVGVELTADNKTVKWDAEDEDDDTMFLSNNLELKQVRNYCGYELLFFC